MTTTTTNPRDEELRKRLRKIFKQYSQTIAMSTDEALEKAMQLIHAHDAIREREIRIDTAKRFDGAYLRYLKHEATQEDEDSIWISRDELIDELTNETNQQTGEK